MTTKLQETFQPKKSIVSLFENDSEGFRELYANQGILLTKDTKTMYASKDTITPTKIPGFSLNKFKNGNMNGPVSDWTQASGWTSETVTIEDDNGTPTLVIATGTEGASQVISGLEIGVEYIIIFRNVSMNWDGNWADKFRVKIGSAADPNVSTILDASQWLYGSDWSLTFTATATEHGVGILGDGTGGFVRFDSAVFAEIVAGESGGTYIANSVSDPTFVRGWWSDGANITTQIVDGQYEVTNDGGSATASDIGTSVDLTGPNSDIYSIIQYGIPMLVEMTVTMLENAGGETVEFGLSSGFGNYELSETVSTAGETKTLKGIYTWDADGNNSAYQMNANFTTSTAGSKFRIDHVSVRQVNVNQNNISAWVDKKVGNISRRENMFINPDNIDQFEGNPHYFERGFPTIYGTNTAYAVKPEVNSTKDYYFNSPVLPYEPTVNNIKMTLSILVRPVNTITRDKNGNLTDLVLVLGNSASDFGVVAFNLSSKTVESSSNNGAFSNTTMKHVAGDTYICSITFFNKWSADIKNLVRVMPKDPLGSYNLATFNSSFYWSGKALGTEEVYLSAFSWAVDKIDPDFFQPLTTKGQLWGNRYASSNEPPFLEYNKDESVFDVSFENNQYLRTSKENLGSKSSSNTVMFVVRPDSGVAGIQHLLSSGTNKGISIFLDDGVLNAAVYQDSGVTTAQGSTDIRDGSLHNITVVYNRESKSLIGRVDGVEEFSVSVADSDKIQPDELVIGLQETTSTSENYNGKMNGVLIIDKAIPTNELSTLEAELLSEA